MIKFLDLKKINDSYEPNISDAITKVLDSGWYLLGNEVNAFESEYGSFIGSKYCIGVANGLDALRLILKAYIEMGIMKEGDEILVPANTYIASILANTDNRLVPVLVEPDFSTYNIDPFKIKEKINSRTRGIMIVHLYGQNAMHEYADTGSYPIMLIVSEPSGCKDTAYATVHVNPYFAFWIPNSFTPNDDDRNEIFIPQGNGYDTQDYFMVIYDRWGREIFYTKDVNEGWNGTYENKYDYTKCVQGTYVYLIRVKDLAGIKHIYKGIVTLIQ